MSGAGKSYWAPQLAAQYGMQSIDLDDIIEVRTGMNIAAFFERYGEAEFRKLERLTLKQVLEVFPNNCVIACGGGTPCFFDNMQVMERSGRVVYLEAGVDFLCSNIVADRNKRPLLEAGNLKEELERLLHHRKATYEQAAWTLHSEGLALHDFEGIIHNKLND